MNPSMSQYRGSGNYHHITQRSPHASATKRGLPPILPHSQQTASPAQAEAAQKAAKMAHEAAKRRAQRPTDKNIPEGVEHIIIGDGVQQYKRLREIERKLDAVMMRKRLDIQDLAQQGPKRYRTMQIWVSNTVENQPWQARNLESDMFDFDTGVEAMYKVKIEGRLLEEDGLEDSPGYGSDDEDGEDPTKFIKTDDSMVSSDESTKPNQPPTTTSTKTRLSHFFKAITIDFDRNKNLQPEIATQIEWKKPLVQPGALLPKEADFDCLEFERKGDENVNCNINFYRDEFPERWRLSKELGDLLDTEEEERAVIIYKIWEYVKAMNLQQDEEKRLVQCDDRLRAIFKTDIIFFPDLSTTSLLLPHISPLPPLSIPYTIRVDPHFHALQPTPSTSYTFRLAGPSPLGPLRIALAQPPTSHLTVLRQLATYDEHLALLVQAMADSKAKHAFLTEMSRDPVRFVRRWVGSQKRDLEVILGESGKGEDAMGEEWRRGGKGGVWGTENVRESVGLMVQKAR